MSTLQKEHVQKCSFTKEKFLSLTPKMQHKWASRILKEDYEWGSISPLYREIEAWLLLESVPMEKEALSERYHYHLKVASIHVKEDRFLKEVRHLDHLSNEPFLPISIYLDDLRSAHNVGSIIRTTEAMRLGSLYFSGSTPPLTHPQVMKTAMGSHSSVPCFTNTFPIQRPFIALETHAKASSLYDFTFPSHFTLILGNEEYGVSKKLLDQSDSIVSIPLFGSKNSLNVAAAFAITAFEIRRQRRTYTRPA